jgi:hypothetical protein
MDGSGGRLLYSLESVLGSVVASEEFALAWGGGLEGGFGRAVVYRDELQEL